MKEVYDIIIGKLERDRLKFVSEMLDLVEDIDYNDMKRAAYYKAQGKSNYCMDLIEFFEEVRDNL